MEHVYWCLLGVTIVTPIRNDPVVSGARMLMFGAGSSQITSPRERRPV